MDHNENAVETTDDFNFGKELAKSFALSTVISAGTTAGILAVAFGITKFSEIKAARKAKKETTED